MCMIFDSHAHYNDERYADNRSEAIDFAANNGVIGIINCGTDIASSEQSVYLSEKYPFFYAAVGYHPECIDDKTVFDESALLRLVSNKKVKAIGEIGLDYYYDTTYKANQIDFFEKQILFAKKNSLPVIIHDREAHKDTLDIIKKHKPNGVLHCFSGSVEMAQEIINSGMYIGIGGVVTFKNAKKLAEVVKSIPLEKILLETDAPYMAPEPFRSKTNNSAYIKYVAEKIAEIKNVDVSTVYKTTVNNTKSLFNI